MYVVAVLKHAIGIPLNDNKRDVEYCTIEGGSRCRPARWSIARDIHCLIKLKGKMEDSTGKLVPERSNEAA